MRQRNAPGVISRVCYKPLYFLVKLFYHKIKVQGADNLPQQASIVVGNHTQMNGPICGEMYYPRAKKVWCAQEMMYLKEVPAYAYKDFWSNKPRYICWFYKCLSYIIAPIAVCIFNNADTIPVYKDTRVMKTFKTTVKELSNNRDIIIFPESYDKYNHIVNDFQKNFIDVARLYYKKTGERVPFVPFYVAPALKTVYIGKPTYFNPEVELDEERERICKYLKEEITKIAQGLPLHKVVPYENKSRKQYVYNKQEGRK